MKIALYILTAFMVCGFITICVLSFQIGWLMLLPVFLTAALFSVALLIAWADINR